MAKKQTVKSSLSLRPPIIAVLGHVDHGKTTLLDNIRKTNVAGVEHGGITQHIGAYQIEVPSEIIKRQKSSTSKITFIDTPGHYAFAKMRSRGAQVSDIAILVVAANDGVKPQTEESIQHIKSADIPHIVVINKIDLPDLNIEKVKKQLSKAGVKLEEYGGDTPLVMLSAKSGQGIDKLLENILLLTDLYQIRESNPGILEAVVIESSLSRNKGIVATIVVRSGSLNIADEVVCENQLFRIRAIQNWDGQNIKKLFSGEAAQIIGWKSPPLVGSKLFMKKQTQLSENPPKKIALPNKPGALTPQEPAPIDEQKIKIILKADTAGTLEAITTGLKDDVEVIYQGVGNVSESDILLAKTTTAIVIAFAHKPSDQVSKLAHSEKVIIKTYNLIYRLFDEIDEVVEAIRKGNMVEILGTAKILALFSIKNENIAGVKVLSGRIAKGDQVKVVRKDEEIGRTKIKSLRHHKEEITKAVTGQEVGVNLAQKMDFLTGDSIISIG